jgi:hypothetical protein
MVAENRRFSGGQPSGVARQVAESKQQLRGTDTIRARRGRTYLVGARWRAGRGAAGKAGHDARKKRRLAAAARHTYRDGTPSSFTILTRWDQIELTMRKNEYNYFTKLEAKGRSTCARANKLRRST